MNDIRIMLADDHIVVRKGLVAMLNEAGGMKVIAEAANGDEAVSLFREHHPDLLLLDLRMPRRDGVEVVAAIREEFLTARIIILTTFDTDEDIYRALRAGAKGFLLKDATFSEIIESIRAVHAGKTCIPALIAAKLAERAAAPELTPRELDVLRLVVQGKSNRDASLTLYVTEETVKSHIKNILAKMGVSDRTSAATMALKRGLVRLD
ncbi:response regulator [Schlesneria paludicola]|uniref:response regulator n=1 Tax=Schlesneria paludicola TaxID=360056 RepID=UPI00029AC818|nr:response regulator transcription factor [Schlesneria paludicola]